MRRKLNKIRLAPAKRTAQGWDRIRGRVKPYAEAALSCGAKSLTMDQLFSLIQEFSRIVDGAKIGGLRLNDVAEVVHQMGCIIDGMDKPYAQWVPSGSEDVYPPRNGEGLEGLCR